MQGHPEDINADAITGVDYEIDGVVSLEATGVRLERILATVMAVKRSCAANSERRVAIEKACPAQSAGVGRARRARESRMR
jgi:hypothetical protein